MEPKFDYNSVPYNFPHCFNKQCSLADKCLRHQVALRMPSERGVVTIVNPSCTASVDASCPYFKADSTQTYALGMTHLLDHVPHNDALIIKQQLLKYFGRPLFYRFWRKERLFTPEQQEYIRELFQKRGICETPVFDEYVEQYEW